MPVVEEWLLMTFSMSFRLPLVMSAFTVTSPTLSSWSILNSRCRYPKDIDICEATEPFVVSTLPPFCIRTALALAAMVAVALPSR